MQSVVDGVTIRLTGAEVKRADRVAGLRLRERGLDDDDDRRHSYRMRAESELALAKALEIEWPERVERYGPDFEPNVYVRVRSQVGPVVPRPWFVWDDEAPSDIVVFISHLGTDRYQIAGWMTVSEGRAHGRDALAPGLRGPRAGTAIDNPKHMHGLDELREIMD